jgi:hypothetical protein
MWHAPQNSALSSGNQGIEHLICCQVIKVEAQHSLSRAHNELKLLAGIRTGILLTMG